MKSVLFLFLFILLIFLLILTPPVQKFITGKVENYLEKKLQTKVEIGSILFGLSGNLNLKNVYVEDRQKDTLLSGGTIKAHYHVQQQCLLVTLDVRPVVQQLTIHGTSRSTQHVHFVVQLVYLGIGHWHI